MIYQTSYGHDETVPSPYLALKPIILVNPFSHCQLSNRTFMDLHYAMESYVYHYMLHIHNVSLRRTNGNLYNSITNRPSDGGGKVMTVVAVKISLVA